MNSVETSLVVGVSDRTLSQWRNNRRRGSCGEWGPRYTQNSPFSEPEYDFNDVQGWADARGRTLAYLPTQDLEYFRKEESEMYDPMKIRMVGYSVIALLIVVMVAFCSRAEAAFGIGLSTEENMRVASIWSYGRDSGLGYAAVGILMQETYAGRYGPVGDAHLPVGRRAYGPMQVRMGAAKMALQHCPELNNGFRYEEEIIAKLITDPEWAIKVGYCYLEYNYQRTGSVRMAISRYNAGGMYQNNLDAHEYIRLVERHARRIADSKTLPVVGDLLLDRMTHIVKRGQTLYEIVKESYDVGSFGEAREIMEKIVDDNPDAFVNNDMNQLKVGTTLEMSRY